VNKMPIADTNIVSCPSCGTLNSRALVNETDGVLWCRCGKLYRLEIDNFRIVKYEILKVDMKWSN
jgi:hypothetical protein